MCIFHWAYGYSLYKTTWFRAQAESEASSTRKRNFFAVVKDSFTTYPALGMSVLHDSAYLSPRTSMPLRTQALNLRLDFGFKAVQLL